MPKFFGKDYQAAVELVRTRPDPSVFHCRYMMLGTLPPLPPEIRNLYAGTTGLQAIDELPPYLEVASFALNTLHSIRCPFPPTLRSLNLTDTMILSLPALPEGLEELFVGGTSLTELPSLPRSLRHLSVSCSKIRSLPPLPEKLARFDMCRTRIEDLEWIPPTLRHFFANHNQLREVPEGFQALLPLNSSTGGPCYIELQPAAYLSPMEPDESAIGWWHRLVREKRQRQRARAEARIAPIKEELIAAAWHPRRVAGWLEAGVDLESL
jgi:hypothetical protein